MLKQTLMNNFDNYSISYIVYHYPFLWIVEWHHFSLVHFCCHLSHLPRYPCCWYICLTTLNLQHHRPRLACYFLQSSVTTLNSREVVVVESHLIGFLSVLVLLSTNLYHTKFVHKLVILFHMCSWYLKLYSKPLKWEQFSFLKFLWYPSTIIFSGMLQRRATLFKS